MAVKEASPVQKLDSPLKESPREGVATLAKGKPSAVKDNNTPTKRKVNFQFNHDRAKDDGDTFNLPLDDQTSHASPLPLSLVNSRNSTGSISETAISSSYSALQKKPYDEEGDDSVPPIAAAVTDADFERRHKSLKDAAWQWATENFSGDTGPLYASQASQISDLPRLCHDHPELAEYVNFLASCPHDQTWEEFFDTRRAFLAFAVLGKVLEVHIFGQEMFGASEAQVKVLRSLDLEMMHQDGFARQVARATIINSLLSSYDKALPQNFISALTDLQARITALVSPLQQPPNPPSSFHESLSYILLTAACLSLEMRRQPSTIYYMRSVTRESPLDLETTHVLNSDQFAHGQLYHDEHHEPIVRIAAWPIVDAYRPGEKPISSSSSSSSSASSTSSEDESSSSFSDHDETSTYKNKRKKKSGLCVRRICKGEAYVEWGILPPVLQRAHYRDNVLASTSSSPPHIQPTARLSLRRDLEARMSPRQRFVLALKNRTSYYYHHHFYHYYYHHHNFYIVAGICILVVAIAIAINIACGRNATADVCAWGVDFILRSELGRRVVKLISRQRTDV